MSLKNKLFTQIFAAKNVDQLAVPDRILERLKGWQDGGDKTHLLFYGPAGVGKTNCAHILKEAHPSLYINCSTNGRMDNLRGEITSFCEQVQLDTDKDSSIKVVFLDEIDGSGISDAFYDGLRGFMDTYEAKVRFIATCNHYNRIPDPLKSRFGGDNCIDFTFQNNDDRKQAYDKYKTRISKIIAACKMKIEDDTLEQMSDKYFPDFRPVLTTLQGLFRAKTQLITKDALIKEAFRYNELYDAIINGTASGKFLHQWIVGDHQSDAVNILQSMDVAMTEYLMMKYPKIAEIDEIMLYIPILACDYNKAMQERVDPTTALKACCAKIMMLMKKYTNK